MANPLKCDLCSKPATVHLTQIVNSKIHKVDLCEACAQAKGVTDPSGFSLADLLLKASLNPEPADVGGRNSWVRAGFGEESPRRRRRRVRIACARAAGRIQQGSTIAHAKRDRVLGGQAAEHFARKRS